MTWCLFNLLCAVLFGILHQGGLIPAMHYLYHHSMSTHCSPYSEDTIVCHDHTTTTSDQGKLPSITHHTHTLIHH
jgi:hypothetical protein